MQKSRGVLLLSVVGCLAIGAAAYQTWQFNQRQLSLQSEADRTARQFASLEIAVADLRTAQAGYVAAGQGPDFWMAKVDELTAQVETLLAERTRTARPDAEPALTAAQTQLASLRVSDRRARGYVRNEQRLLASDVIFVESLEILNRLATELATARDTEALAARQEATTVRQYEMAVAGGASLVLLLLLFSAGAVRGRAAPAPAAIESVVAPTSVIAPAPPVKGVKPPPNAMGMSETADVCVDLARLLDGRDLPALLGRAATAIGAKGLVLWVVDEPRTQLKATIGHGYSEKTLQRLGSLPIDADNVTSVACRTLKPQVMPAASATASGALAVPLIGSTGCVGVLAAEVTGTASDGSTLPSARVIAAQLAGLITPLPSAASGETSAAASH